MKVGWFERIALKHVYYSMWNRSPVYVFESVLMRWMKLEPIIQSVLRAGALGWPWGMGWGGIQEGGSGWETYVHPWLIHVNIWQKPPQYCKVISLQLKLKKIKIKRKSWGINLTRKAQHLYENCKIFEGYKTNCE